MPIRSAFHAHTAGRIRGQAANENRRCQRSGTVPRTGQISGHPNDLRGKPRSDTDALSACFNCGLETGDAPKRIAARRVVDWPRPVTLPGRV
jgi:hypothetical protein